MTSFDKCLALVLKHEGGLSDNPKDPGGLTKYGVSQRAYPDVDIRALTPETAGQIYARDFWQPIHGDELPPALAMVTFDAAVNSGVRRASEWLQEVVGAQVDGKIGPKTIDACKRVDIHSAVLDYTDLRMRYLQSLPTWGAFGHGWSNRVHDTEAQALAEV